MKQILLGLIGICGLLSCPQVSFAQYASASMTLVDIESLYPGFAKTNSTWHLDYSNGTSSVNQGNNGNVGVLAYAYSNKDSSIQGYREETWTFEGSTIPESNNFLINYGYSASMTNNPFYATAASCDISYDDLFEGSTTEIFTPNSSDFRYFYVERPSPGGVAIVRVTIGANAHAHPS